MPGVNHFSICSSSSPVCNQRLIGPEKPKSKPMNIKLSKVFKTSEEDAIPIFSSLFPATYLICAFFKRFVLLVSNNVVIIRKKAHMPICGLDNPHRIRMTKLINPKSVRENRCRVEKKADRNQYDAKYFFKGVALRVIHKRQTYIKLLATYHIKDELSSFLK